MCTSATKSRPSATLVVILVAAITTVLLLKIRGSRLDTLYKARLNNLEDRCRALGVDIYTFLGERDQLNQDVTKFDSETVHQYHLRFGERIVKLADEAVAVGVPRDDLALLYEAPKNPAEVRYVAYFLKAEVMTMAECVAKLATDDDSA